MSRMLPVFLHEPYPVHASSDPVDGPWTRKLFIQEPLPEHAIFRNPVSLALLHAFGPWHLAVQRFPSGHLNSLFLQELATLQLKMWLAPEMIQGSPPDSCVDP